MLKKQIQISAQNVIPADSEIESYINYLSTYKNIWNQSYLYCIFTVYVWAIKVWAGDGIPIPAAYRVIFGRDYTGPIYTLCVELYFT